MGAFAVLVPLPIHLLLIYFQLELINWQVLLL